MRTVNEVRGFILFEHKIAPEDVVVGYEDRFKGIVEIPFTEWVATNEDIHNTEVFIPQHRIAYFRRATCKTQYLWHKKLRIDLPKSLLKLQMTSTPPSDPLICHPHPHRPHHDSPSPQYGRRSTDSSPD